MILVILAAGFGAAYLLDTRRARSHTEAHYRAQVDLRLRALGLSQEHNEFSRDLAPAQQ